MTQEEKQILLKDLSARLPYFPLVQATDDDGVQCVCKIVAFDLETKELALTYSSDFKEWDYYDLEEVKPYIRSVSSMTEEENIYYNTVFITLKYWEKEDWLNAHHFDYRGLIEKGLALEAPEGMY